MRTILFFGVFLLSFATTLLGQTCFNAYDAMFENGGDTMSYQAFHQRELNFLKNLKNCQAPDFNGTTLDGNDLVLSELQGKVVVLNFWFTTCIPCLKEIPQLNSLVDRYSTDEVVFIGLARDNTQKLTNFFKRYVRFKYQIIPESYSIATTYKVIAWPQSMVIDKHGRVYQSWAGTDKGTEVLVTEIHQAIEQCLLEK